MRNWAREERIFQKEKPQGLHLLWLYDVLLVNNGSVGSVWIFDSLKVLLTLLPSVIEQRLLGNGIYNYLPASQRVTFSDKHTRIAK